MSQRVMNGGITRRDFLKSGSLLALAAAISPLFDTSASANYAAGKWYRGNLHMHSQWSDGGAMPEMAVHWYKSHGYDFICPSDHNIFQSSQLRLDGFGCAKPPVDLSEFDGEDSFWKVVSPSEGWAKLTEKRIQEAISQFGAESVRTRTVGEHKFVRMRTFDELSEQFCQDGQFLMIPGFEQTGGCIDGRQVHMNYINVRESFTYITGDSPKSVISQTFAKGEQLYSGQDYIFTINHPLWRYYDVPVEAIIALPQLQFVELNNNGLTYSAHDQGWEPEAFWDYVNAWRASHDQALIFATGTDDRHNYDSPKAAKAWNMVQAPELSAGAILSSMRAGNFYTSTGANFERIEFDPQARTLYVKAKSDAGQQYKISFLGTRRGYNSTITKVESQAEDKRPARTIETWSDQIGQTFQTSTGVEATYRMSPDDLYVRAKITGVLTESEREWVYPNGAWTQAFK